ncbi:Nitroreductase family protein [Planctomycetes bacterium Pla163]|uniref:Nitroreductase family protein n=1 Tax=Rohdeia mirabilis TaxID=2528008 RepID=A0A518CUT1_9BACT|nr:Nitroreductase family protein [Planctomycetes bacterium Pla163]
MSWRRIFHRGGSDPADSPNAGSGSAGPASEPDHPADPALALVRDYHRATKHAPARFARGPGWMDWDTQPSPFRRWEGAEFVPLDRPEPTAAGEPFELAPGDALYEHVFALGRVAPAPLDRAFVSQLFFDSLALSAWKRAGEAHWSLRVNPSSGNLHPTEGYLLAPAIPGSSDEPLLAHYAPKEHGLEVRARIPQDLWTRLVAGLPADTVLVGLTSIHWRESWKYGERAYRYCQHDAGHALACVTLAAAARGWRATLLDGLGSDELGALLGTGDTAHPEAEEPDLLVALHPVGSEVSVTRLDAAAIAEIASLERRGIPNTLSPDHEDWPAIDAVAAACSKPADVLARGGFEPPFAPLEVGDEPISFRRIARGRRSAVAMDARSGLARDGFYQTLRRTLPGRDEAPWCALPWRPRVHLALFVHRVADVDPGLYLLLRDPGALDELRAALDPNFTWERAPECPDDLPLYHLRTGDARGLAAHLSCDQAIAGEGCFAVAMLARFDASLEEDGPWMYPRLFWETGAIGQTLYLEAEALGLRATGIGCYFDDGVHGALGMSRAPGASGRAFQSLYHFTVGGAVDDARITTEPAYPVAGGGGPN